MPIHASLRLELPIELTPELTPPKDARSHAVVARCRPEFCVSRPEGLLALWRHGYFGSLCHDHLRHDISVVPEQAA